MGQFYRVFQLGGTLGSLFDSSHKPENYISLPNLPACDGAIYMYGDTMAPEVKSGDIVVYKRVKDLRNGLFLGQMYLLSLAVDGEEYIMIKYIQKSENRDHVKLVSSNEHYPPKDIPLESIKTLAMIKASIRYNTMV